MSIAITLNNSKTRTGTEIMSDIEIARRANKTPILKLASESYGIAADSLVPYGHDKAKLSIDAIRQLDGKPDGKLVLVTAISPTPAGEGKTTTTVGLGDAMNHIGRKNYNLPARTFTWAMLRS